MSHPNLPERKVSQFFISVTLVITSLVTGVLAFAMAEAVQLGGWEEYWSSYGGRGIFEPIANAIGFVALEGLDLGSDVKNPNILPKEVYLLFLASRGLAVAFVVNAAFAISLNILGNSYRLWRARHPIVVIGLGWKGRKICEELLRSKCHARLIVLDRQIDPAFEQWCKEKGIAMVLGDALEAKSLRRACIEAASKVYIFCGEDETSMQIAQTASEILLKGKSLENTVPCFVELKSQRNFSVLRSAIDDESSRLCPRLFNAEAVTVRMLLKHPIKESHYTCGIDHFDSFEHARVAHTVIIGTNPFAWEILKQVMQIGHFEAGKSLHISVVAEDPKAFSREFIERYPAFEHTKGGFQPHASWVREESILPEISLYRMPDHDEAFFYDTTRLDTILCPTGIKPSEQVLSIFITLGEGVRSAVLAASACCHFENYKEREGIDARMLVYTPTGGSSFTKNVDDNLNKTAVVLECIAFEDFMGSFDVEMVEGRTLDAQASELNALYRYGKDGPRADDAIDEAWDKASEVDKDSSRQAAVHAALKKRIYKRLKLPESQKKAELARVEHRRWCSEYLLRGFRPLVSIPSEYLDPTDWPGLSRAEKDSVNQWFGWTEAGKPMKQAFKARHLHIDLMPLGDISKVLGECDNEKRLKQLEKELNKDSILIDFSLGYGRAKKSGI